MKILIIVLLISLVLIASAEDSCETHFRNCVSCLNKKGCAYSGFIDSWGEDGHCYNNQTNGYIGGYTAVLVPDECLCMAQFNRRDCVILPQCVWCLKYGFCSGYSQPVCRWNQTSDNNSQISKTNMFAFSFVMKLFRMLTNF